MFEIRNPYPNEYFEKYTAGMWYPKKGTYLGVSKGKHKFKRHNVQKKFHMDGAKYHYESIAEIDAGLLASVRRMLAYN